MSKAASIFKTPSFHQSEDWKGISTEVCLCAHVTPFFLPIDTHHIHFPCRFIVRVTASYHTIRYISYGTYHTVHLWHGFGGRKTFGSAHSALLFDFLQSSVTRTRSSAIMVCFSQLSPSYFADFADHRVHPTLLRAMSCVAVRSWSRVSAAPFSAGPQFSAVKIVWHNLVLQSTVL